MKAPTTKQARNLIKLAIVMNDASTYYGNCWTDKTSKKDTNRRSVSFMISSTKANAILATVKQMYQDLGYTSPVKLTTSEADWFTRSGGYTYIRAIATLDK